MPKFYILLHDAKTVVFHKLVLF